MLYLTKAVLSEQQIVKTRYTEGALDIRHLALSDSTLDLEV